MAANPKNTTHLDLQKEAKEIAEGLQRSKKGDNFQLEQQWAVTPREMQRAVLDYKPEIVKPGALIRIKAPRQMGKTSLSEFYTTPRNRDIKRLI